MSKKPPTKMEKVLHGSQILSNATTFFAAIVLGVWGVYSTVYVSKAREIAEYTLKDLELKTQQTSHIQAKLETSLKAVTFPESGQLLTINVTLSNGGSKESRVTLDDESLALIPVSFIDGSPRYQLPINIIKGRYPGTLGRFPLNWIDIGAGESYELTYVHLISRPGIYLVHFLSHNGTVPSEDINKSTVLPFKYSVGADHYLIIE